MITSQTKGPLLFKFHLPNPHLTTYPQGPSIPWANPPQASLGLRLSCAHWPETDLSFPTLGNRGIRRVFSVLQPTPTRGWPTGHMRGSDSHH
jgi:hypothetical protein